MTGDSERQVRDRGGQMSQADTARICNLQEAWMLLIQVISHAIFTHNVLQIFIVNTSIWSENRKPR